MANLVLASGSPRRRELLEQIGVQIRTCPVDIDERVQAGESAETYVVRLAKEKAEAGLAFAEGLPVLGSDTSVVIDDEILGKPSSLEDAHGMLRRLSAQCHDVMTAVAVVNENECYSVLVKTQVRFRALSEEEIQDYCATGEPMDKAGAYGIQGLGAVFVEHIEGSYSGVVGLPLTETAALLKKINVPIWGQ